ncbi:MAG: AI-2E family transporter, partial [Oscillospiraceae bacterium]|nr:AI-2E family transporter [Oscillospiraceae bacterium]
MRRRFHWDKKYLYWGITAFCVIACAILFYMALSYLGLLGRGLKSLARILSPFIWGLVIAYLLNPLVKILQKRVFGPLSRKLFAKSRRSAGQGLARGLSVFFSEVFMLAIITGLFFLIIPQLYSSIETIIVNSPAYI